MLRIVPLVALLLAPRLVADEAAQLALLVNEAVVDSAKVTTALGSSDPLLRATAARLAAVRSVAVVPALREALTTERIAETAREEIRALVLLGSDDDVAFAASQLPRFPASIDGDFAEAVARLGAPRAIDLYLRHAPALRGASPALEYALWGRGSAASVTASRFLGAKNERAFAAALKTAYDAGVVLDPGVIGSALSSPPSAVDALWYVIRTYAANPAGMPEAIRASAAAPREGAGAEEAFARAVVARMGGAALEDQKEWIVWLRSREGRVRVPKTKAVLRFLTLDEQNALRDEKLPKPPPTGDTIPMMGPTFSIPIALPAGLAPRILAETACRGGWIGTARAAVDRAGRVQTLIPPTTGGTRACFAALEAMMRLSFAQPSSIAAPFAANDLIVLKAPGSSGCFDESAVDETTGAQTSRIEGNVRAPVVVRRVEPHYPESVRRAAGTTPMSLTLEALITKSGCVRNIRMLSRTQFPELNGAAAEALSQWKFKPGTLDGHPVDVLFNLTITFRR